MRRGLDALAWILLLIAILITVHLMVNVVFDAVACPRPPMPGQFYGVPIDPCA